MIYSEKNEFALKRLHSFRDSYICNVHGLYKNRYWYKCIIIIKVINKLLNKNLAMISSKAKIITNKTMGLYA